MKFPTLNPIEIYTTTRFGKRDILPLEIQTRNIKDLAVTTAKIENLAVTTAKIENLAVTTAKIENLAVTTAKIDDLTVTNAKVASGLSAAKVTTGILQSSDGKTFFDLDTAKRIIINDGTNDRVLLGLDTGGF